MRKILITESGNIGFLSGANINGLSMEFTTPNGVEVPTQEIDASSMNEKDWEKLTKEKDKKRTLGEIGKKFKEVRNKLPK